MHANSLKNLKPFPKGFSGYAGKGKSHLPEELKGIRALSAFEVNRMIARYARMIMSSLLEKLEDPGTTVLELAIASIFQKSIQQGDFAKLSFLLDRCIGKVQINIEEDEDDLDAREEIKNLSMSELLTLIKTPTKEIE